MCEPTGVRKALNQIPFKVSALATAFEPGSFERSLVESVCDSIRKDVEYIMKRLDGDSSFYFEGIETNIKDD